MTMDVVVVLALCLLGAAALVFLVFWGFVMAVAGRFVMFVVRELTTDRSGKAGR